MPTAKYLVHDEFNRICTILELKILMGEKSEKNSLVQTVLCQNIFFVFNLYANVQ